MRGIDPVLPEDKLLQAPWLTTIAQYVACPISVNKSTKDVQIHE